jgi:hypothetical protein
MLKRAFVGLATVFLLATLVMAPTPAWAQEEDVDLLLVLAADVSRSVDEQKFRLQRGGYANAITDPRVVNAMIAGPRGRIAIMFVEWSGDGDQAVVLDWTMISSPDDAQRAADNVRTAARAFMGRTSISSAIDFSMAQLRRSPYRSPRRVIDISGDGTNKSGRDVATARDEAVAQGVVINGLVILSEVPLAFNPTHTHPPGGLTKYFETNVMGGPASFVVEAESFEAFGRSLISKLIKEVAAAPAYPPG